MSKSLIKIVKEVGRISTNSVSHYVFTDGEGKIHKQFNDICFARFRSLSGIKKARMLINQDKDERRVAVKDFTESFKKFFSYITKRSMFRDAFLNRCRNWEVNGIGLNCSLTPTQLIAAMTALRSGYERPSLSVSFAKLSESGFTEDEAFVLSNILDYKGGDSFEIRNGLSGHGIWCYTISLMELRKYCERQIDWPDEHPVNKVCNGWKVHKTFEKRGIDLNERFLNVSTLEKRGWQEVRLITIKQIKEVLGK